MLDVLPATLQFRFSLPVRRRDDLPNPKAPWLRLGPEYELPTPSWLDRGPAPISWRAAWSPEGLGMSLEVRGRSSPLHCDANELMQSDGCRLWFDTRDTKNVHQATRFCQSFHVLPQGKGAGRRQPFVGPALIGRARNDAPTTDPDRILAWSQVEATGYSLELWFPGEALYGYDPTSQPRLGFFWALRDRDLGAHYFSVSPPAPFFMDPSVWGTLELMPDAA